MKISGQMFHCYGSDEQPFVNQQMINVDAIRENNDNRIHNNWIHLHQDSLKCGGYKNKFGNQICQMHSKLAHAN